MSNDNTQDTNEPSLASAGSVGEVLARGIADIIRIVTEPDWIPVVERLPERGSAVWVFDGTDVEMGEYWGEDGFQSYGASCDREGLNSEHLHGITHWMEIEEPAPPTDAK